MKIMSKVIVLLFGVAFLIMCYGAFKKEPISLLKAALICFLPFVIVTLLRRLINAPRPYEIYDFYDEKPKNKSGKSFPSRHVYSASVIATLTVFVYPVIGGILAVLAVSLAIFRVLLGIHFVRDVLAGVLIGAGAALIGVLIFSPF